MTTIQKKLRELISKDFSLNNENIKNYQYMRFMSMLYQTLLLASTVSAYKIVMIGFIPEPGSTLIYTFSFFFANIITEVYGETIAKKLVIESIICGYVFALLISVINLLPSPDFWSNSESFNHVLGHVLRFTNAGVIGYLISSRLNIYLFSKSKTMWSINLFWLRSLLAASLSEGIATFIAGFITFFQMIPAEKIFIVMGSALLFKIVYGFIAVWPANFIAFILKKKEYEII